MIEKINLNNILFLDIETVPEAEDFNVVSQVAAVDERSSRQAGLHPADDARRNAVGTGARHRTSAARSRAADTRAARQRCKPSCQSGGFHPNVAAKRLPSSALYAGRFAAVG